MELVELVEESVELVGTSLEVEVEVAKSAVALELVAASVDEIDESVKLFCSTLTEELVDEEVNVLVCNDEDSSCGPGDVETLEVSELVKDEVVSVLAVAPD